VIESPSGEGWAQGAIKRLVVDGNEQTEKFVPLIDDRNHHNVEVDVG